MHFDRAGGAPVPLDDGAVVWLLPDGAASFEPGSGPVACALLRRGPQLWVVPIAGPVVVDGRHARAPLLVDPGRTLRIGRDSFSLRHADTAPPEASSCAVAAPTLPSGMRLVTGSGGNTLLVTLDGGETVVVPLSALRARLLRRLLRNPGRSVRDEDMIPFVWPDEVRTRLDLNQLVHRTRRQLVEAGLDGAGILRRLPTGGATALILAPAEPEGRPAGG